MAATVRSTLVKKLRPLNRGRPRASIRTGRPDIISEHLCDDILQRLTPFLQRNAPLDILDFWPGAGLWSSKVNNFLKPRRHVLVEPESNKYSAELLRLAESNPSYQCIYAPLNTNIDWPSIFTVNLPEQGPPSRNTAGVLTKNDTLLVLAHPPSTSSRDHFTPARWWQNFLGGCMDLSGSNTYGVVRVLATLPTSEARSIIPRSLSSRKRVAILTEGIASHAFEIAASHDPGSWIDLAGWDLMTDNASYVFKKTTDHKIFAPARREPEPILMAPEVPTSPRYSCPYAPRAKSAGHDRFIADIQTGKEPGSSRVQKQKAASSLRELKRENLQAFHIQKGVKRQMMIDSLVRRLSRDAADPANSYATLKPLADEIEEMHNNRDIVAEIDDRYIQRYMVALDNRRAVHASSSFDNALLAWWRRPFEPLKIDEKETQPLKTDITMFYFEANANSAVVNLRSSIEPSIRVEVEKVFDAISLTLGANGALSMAKVSEVLFPGRKDNDLVRAVPKLATYAYKKLKSEFDNLPKTVHRGPAYEKGSDLSDPADCFQENLDYDLSDVRIRLLPPITIWEIALESQKDLGQVDPVQLVRSLGGTLTSYQTGFTENGRSQDGFSSAKPPTVH